MGLNTTSTLRVQHAVHEPVHDDEVARLQRDGPSDRGKAQGNG
jgi:hypothetical protein